VESFSGPNPFELLIVFVVIYLPIAAVLIAILPWVGLTLWNVFWTAVILRGASALAILNATSGRAW
jgi:hypothetical protein